MKISVELSMYPLDKDYKPSIIHFIKRLRTYDVEIETSGMSTQVFGDYDEVMRMIEKEVKPVFAEAHKVAIVMKLINDDLSGPIKF